MSPPEPSYRKLVSAGLIILLIAAWALVVLLAVPVVGNLPILVQAIFYLAAGIAWIFPLKPLVRWSETGRWTKAAAGEDGSKG
ncbi:DUF2842 domain-containing protein [Sphingomonas piscis]|uniref:DUF2842 domain-containing protein n=1 Tax=Sphingomonas piscis TaxID=2714943 RepID=A0A6G7YLN7_9SPHN|nr:DUF2842 domain-containing protein [Sphingomonas piscis]QIK77647.1 DUF2842 domain-containing protein [Sphingomonas piscis]